MKKCTNGISFIRMKWHKEEHEVSIIRKPVSLNKTRLYRKRGLVFYNRLKSYSNTSVYKVVLTMIMIPMIITFICIFFIDYKWVYLIWSCFVWLIIGKHLLWREVFSERGFRLPMAGTPVTAKGGCWFSCSVSEQVKILCECMFLSWMFMLINL